MFRPLGLAICLLSVIATSQIKSKPLSNDDVIQMVALGLSDDVIIEKIRSVAATNFDTSVTSLKSLKAAKVSDAVLKAMINPHNPMADKQPAPGSNPDGKALAARAVDYMGGLPKLQSVRSLSLDLMRTPKSPQQQGTMHIKAVLVFPDRGRFETESTEGTIIDVTTPDASFVSAPSTGLRDRSAEQKTDALRQLHRYSVYVGQHLNDPAFAFADVGTKKIGRTETRMVAIDGPGVSVRWFVEPQTGRILREDYPYNGMIATTDFEDWRASDGLTLPYIRKFGEDTVQYNSVQINPTVDPKIFERPAIQRSANQGAHSRLALLSSRGYEGAGYMIVEGQVQNISDSSLESVQAVASWYSKDGSFISSGDALIGYTPILPGQTSPFKIFTRINPEMQRFSVEFMAFAAGTIDTIDRRTGIRGDESTGEASVSTASRPNEAAATLPASATSNTEAGKTKDETGNPRSLKRPPPTGSTLENAGSLSGKLSLITGSGDLKPARLADLFLLYADSNDSPALRYSTAVEGKVNAYSDNCKAEAAKVEADTKAGRFSSSVSSCGVEEAIACEMVIIGKKTLRETLDASKASQFQETQADEEGVFSFSKVPPGMYYLVAFGRAGLNVANWRTLVTTKAGEDVVVKLPSPVASCFMGPN